MSLRAGENDVTLRFEQKDASKSPATSLLVRELCVLDEPAPTTRPADAWPAAN